MKTWCTIMVGVVSFTMSASSLGEIHSDPDTGKWIEDGFDVSIYAQVPDKIFRFEFGNGGNFGTDLYVVTGQSSSSKIYKVNSARQATLFTTLPTSIFGIAFPNANSAFGDYIYLGSGDGYWNGNKNIYRVGNSGNATVFFGGNNFLGGTANAINFAPAGSSFVDYLYTHDDNPDKSYRIGSNGIAYQFGGNIPLAFDFIFDRWGRFGGDMFVIQSEKSEHGSSSDNIYRITSNGTTTLFLPDASQVHNGGGTITAPDSIFGGDMYYINNDWAYGSGGRIYRVTPNGTRTIFAQGFNVWDGSDITYGPDGYLYVADYSSGTIYQITPEPATILLIGLGGFILRRNRK